MPSSVTHSLHSPLRVLTVRSKRFRLGTALAVRMITELINGGLAALTHENIRAGGSANAASWITDAGRDALAIEG